jgi:hypothetical protein
MPKRDFTEEPTVEVTPGAKPDFDFTIEVEVMDSLTREAYYRVQRIAILRGDASLLPDGKTMSREEVGR